MKYIKHYYVDPVTLEPFSTDASVGVNGKTHPPIPNLDVKFWLTDTNGVDICYSVIGDIDVSSVAGVTELTEEEWFNEVEADFLKQKENRKNQVFVIVQQIKSEIIDKWWHPSEIAAAMTIKLAESQAALAAADEAAARNVAPFLTIEADTRMITVKELAQRVMSNYNGLIAGEALVSGHRGLLCDQIEAIVFDRTDTETARQSYANLGAFKVNEGFTQIREQLGL